MQLSTFVSVVVVLLASGCMGTADHPPSLTTPPAPQCPVDAEPQMKTINTEIGEYNLTTPSGGSYSYADFQWDWPSGSRIVMHVHAEWDAGLLGEKAMQLRVFDRDDALNHDRFASASGPSPIDLNFTLMVPDEARLAVGMAPQGLAVSKASVDTHVRLVQTLLCD